MYEVGKSYWMPTVKKLIRYKKTDTVEVKMFVFVIFHEHVGDISGEAHRHVDSRFLPDEYIELLNIKLDEILAIGTDEQIWPQQMICHRKYMPIKRFDSLNTRNDFLLIQNRNKDCVMTNNTCPHQGCDLGNVPATKINGKNAIVCPCHGLTWEISTGKMLKRLPRKNFVS